MTHDVALTVAAHVTILLTTIAGFVYSWLREGRRHRSRRQAAGYQG